MHSAAVDLFQMLVQAGAVPGEDFSCDGENEAFRLGERCHELLRHAYPDVDWDDIFAPCPYDASPEIAMLHQHLGVPFVDRLLAQMHCRLQELPDAEAAWYLRQLLVGVEQRTGLLLYPLLTEEMTLSALARLEWLLRLEDVEPCSFWLEDLILAAGGSPEDVQISENDCWLTEQGMDLLEMLWAGEVELTLESAQQR
ncbi:hypothetical protein [Pseudanabaena sp. FACHB-2040]|uniref:hypothetical protein n=1 Tax=Pseudanabaena sp. FACHB-2040 TaxID=2692859 RepID=UPI00168787A3|nr:hypothetical protein [Pseudanabaena sp. FACHB-2040]MBD2259174.1 hypothetical protein [Pseudanabaena sp. FACHB-2040]